MGQEHISTICNDVSYALQSVRGLFNSTPATEEILNRYWALQDHLHRLVDALSDDETEARNVFCQEHAHLVADITDLLSSTAKRHIARIAAVKDACDAINESLIKIEDLKHSAALTASA